MIRRPPAEELLERDGITVTESMNMVLGRTQQIELSMNQIAADSNPEITFESADPKVWLKYPRTAW